MENLDQNLNELSVEKSDGQTLNAAASSTPSNLCKKLDLSLNSKRDGQANSQSGWQPLILASVLTAALFGLTTLCSWRFAKQKADQWGQNLKYYSELDSTSDRTPTSKIETNLNIYLQEFAHSTSAEKARVKEQLATIRSRAKTHLYAARDIYIWSSVVVGIASLASVVTALCLLHITRRGGDNANSFVSGIFVISLGSLALSSSFIVLYQYDRNIKTNANLYISYINLEEEVLTVLASKLPSNDRPIIQNKEPIQPSLSDSVRLKELIQNNNKILKEYNALSLEFDLNNIPSADEILKKAELSK